MKQRFLSLLEFHLSFEMLISIEFGVVHRAVEMTDQLL